MNAVAGVSKAEYRVSNFEEVFDETNQRKFKFKEYSVLSCKRRKMS